MRHLRLRCAKGFASRRRCQPCACLCHPFRMGRMVWIRIRGCRSRFLKLRYFDFRGNAQFVYLARPLGPGPRFILSFQGPTAWPFTLCWQPRHHKLSDLWPLRCLFLNTQPFKPGLSKHRAFGPKKPVTAQLQNA